MLSAASCSEALRKGDVHVQQTCLHAVLRAMLHLSALCWAGVATPPCSSRILGSLLPKISLNERMSYQHRLTPLACCLQHLPLPPLISFVCVCVCVFLAPRSGLPAHRGRPQGRCNPGQAHRGRLFQDEIGEKSGLVPLSGSAALARWIVEMLLLL